MPTPPTPPTYWWLTVRIDACRTRDERVAAASGDDAVRMWRELHPNVEVIHVRPVPELVDIELEHMSINNNTDPIRGVPPLLAARAALAEPVADEPAAGEAGELASLIREAVRAWVAWEEGAVMLNNMTAVQLTRAADLLEQRHPVPVPVPDGPAVAEGREPASVVSEPSDEELALIYHDCCRGCEFMDQGGFEDAARAVLARFGNHSPDATKMVGPAAGDVAELVAWLRGANWDSKRQTLATRTADLLEGLNSGWVVPTVEQFAPVPVPVSERLPGPEDCDAEGRCWWVLEESDDYEACWTLRKMNGIPFDNTRWLPATALPLPKEVEK